jgi:hypothetical protein
MTDLYTRLAREIDNRLRTQITLSVISTACKLPRKRQKLKSTSAWQARVTGGSQEELIGHGEAQERDQGMDQGVKFVRALFMLSPSLLPCVLRLCASNHCPPSRPEYPSLCSPTHRLHSPFYKLSVAGRFCNTARSSRWTIAALLITALLNEYATISP